MGFDEILETFTTAEGILECCQLCLDSSFELGGAHGCGSGSGFSKPTWRMKCGESFTSRSVNNRIECWDIDRRNYSSAISEECRRRSKAQRKKKPDITSRRFSWWLLHKIMSLSSPYPLRYRDPDNGGIPACEWQVLGRIQLVSIVQGS
jgi:hypothetical protein